jgi:hypothetical protein
MFRYLWGLILQINSALFLRKHIVGGWKCPEEEHTTCSGGPTINCHKRGLRGEMYFIK